MSDRKWRDQEIIREEREHGLMAVAEANSTIAHWRDRATTAEAALTACRQDTAKLIAEAVAAERAAGARIALDYDPQHEANTTIARQVARNIAVMIEARARTTGGSDHGE